MSTRRRFITAVLALAAGPAALPGAHANELPDDLVLAVRQVIEGQLQAMAEGNAQRAFSFAAPGIRQQFGNATRFMAMVNGSYPMVVRPASTAFFRPTLDDGDVLQVVALRDRDGRHWRATYRLERQDDASWRIAGCQVAPAAPGEAT